MYPLTQRRGRIDARLAALTMVLLAIMVPARNCGEAGHGFGGGF